LAGKAPHVLILVPDPVYPEPWAWAFHVEANALRAAEFEVSARPWTAPGDLAPFDAVLPLVVWGYHERYAEWLALLDALDAGPVPCINPPDLLRWNSDKAYLAELDAKGVPTVHTIAVDALDEHALREARDRFQCEQLVVKPPVSASATGTFLLQPGDAVPREVAGTRMLVQPFMAAIAAHGEYSLMLFDGRFSHAILKTPKSGDFRVQPHLGGTERPCDAPPGGIELAQAALAVAPADAVYARVDMVEDGAGDLRIMELELIEPALWLQHAPDAGAAFASAVASAIEQPLAQR
jgi:glutathione synthase/RimK-type ligase-like ATP-grasp enzyme